MSKKETGKFQTLVEQIKACFPTKNGIYTLKQFNEVCRNVLITLSKNREIIRKTIDKKPILEYEGRHIQIKVDGNCRTAKILIDGKPNLKVVSCNISLKAGNFPPIVTMELLDI